MLLASVLVHAVQLSWPVFNLKTLSTIPHRHFAAAKGVDQLLLLVFIVKY